MPDPTGSAPVDLERIAASTRRKMAWRILPLVMAMYVIAYLDRANLGFAAAPMLEQLQFTADVYGYGVGLFFVGYLLLEVPGALLVEHWSARKWFARILITWGLCSAGMAFVRTPEQFYLARFLLGLAEAGFFPGVIVYFTHWFPRAERARALSIMLLGVPGSLLLGSQVSAVLLQHPALDLAGWQWVFIVEGIPAVILGIAVPFLLPDRPRDAHWLTTEERDWLESTLEREHQETAALTGRITLAQALRQRTVWLLALGILFTNVGGYALVYWLPLAIKGMLQATGTDPTNSDVLGWASWTYLGGLAGVLISGRSSDATGDRKWHCIAGQVGSGVFLAMSVIPGQPWPLVFTWLCLTGFCSTFWITPFWVLPTLALTSSAAAVSIGFINMCANVAGLIGSPIFGRMKAAGLPDAAGLIFLATAYALGGVFVAQIRLQRKDQAT